MVVKNITLQLSEQHIEALKNRFPQLKSNYSRAQAAILLALGMVSDNPTLNNVKAALNTEPKEVKHD